MIDWRFSNRFNRRPEKIFEAKLLWIWWNTSKKAEHWTALYFQLLFGILCAAIGSSYIWMEWIFSSLTRAYLVNTLLRTLSSVSSFSLVCHLFAPVCPFIYSESSFSSPVWSFFSSVFSFFLQCVRCRHNISLKTGKPWMCFFIFTFCLWMWNIWKVLSAVIQADFGSYPFLTSCR